MRIVLITVAVALATAGCAGAYSRPTQTPGWVAGIALGGRTLCPTPTLTGLHCHSGPRPYALVVVVGASAHRKVRADRSGRFKVRVPAGRYAIRLGTGAPLEVRVHPGRVTRVGVGGIRER